MSTRTTARPAQTDARGRLPAPMRDRRPALAALAVLLILGGALASALVAYRSGGRVDVLVARHDIPIGQAVGPADFGVARVAADGAAVVEAAAAANFTGAAATTRIPAGTLINRTMFARGSVIPATAIVVGVVLSAQQRPAAGLRAGDVVRVYAVPRDSSGVAAATQLAAAVRIAEVGTAGDNAANVRLSLLVDGQQANGVVAAAAAGQIVVTRLSADTQPAVDFGKG